MAVEPLMPCGTCLPCRRGHSNCCTRMKTIGVQVDGGLCERIALPAANLYPTGDLPADVAVLSEPLSIGEHAVARSKVEAGDQVVVFGAGPVGSGHPRRGRGPGRPGHGRGHAGGPPDAGRILRGRGHRRCEQRGHRGGRREPGPRKRARSASSRPVVCRRCSSRRSESWVPRARSSWSACPPSRPVSRSSPSPARS